MKTWSELQAADVMSAPVSVVRTESSLADAAQTLVDEGISGALVLSEDGQAVGVVSLFDVVTHLADLEVTVGGLRGFFYRVMEDREEVGAPGIRVEHEDVLRRTRVKEVMTDEIHAVEQDMLLGDLVREMLVRRIHRVFVRQGDSLVGVVSTFDVLRALAGETANAPARGRRSQIPSYLFLQRRASTWRSRRPDPPSVAG